MIPVIIAFETSPAAKSPEVHGSGSAPGKGPTTCRSCNGRGQVRYQQGFFSIARTCPTCQGTGSVITDPCPKCKGEGRLLRQRTVDAKVPAGVEDGTRIRFAGAGEVGQFGGPAGDLYVVLHVKEHPFFEREGNDLHCVVPISVAQAAMGAEIRVPTMEGEHNLRVPEGTQPGTTFRIRNKGVPVLNGHEQEERRLFYVAMTRARDSLRIYAREGTGKTDKTPPDRKSVV